MPPPRKSAVLAASYSALSVISGTAGAASASFKKKATTVDEPPAVEHVEPAAPPAEAPPEPTTGLGEPLASMTDASLSGNANETMASNCRCYGGGLQEATVGKHAFFWIEAVDGNGVKRARGGDSFFVAIRGPSHVRARAHSPTAPRPRPRPAGAGA